MPGYHEIETTDWDDRQLGEFVRLRLDKGETVHVVRRGNEELLRSADCTCSVLSESAAPPATRPQPKQP